MSQMHRLLDVPVVTSSATGPEVEIGRCVPVEGPAVMVELSPSSQADLIKRESVWKQSLGAALLLLIWQEKDQFFGVPVVPSVS